MPSVCQRTLSADRESGTRHGIATNSVTLSAYVTQPGHMGP
jgi:hypothetical protein